MHARTHTHTHTHIHPTHSFAYFCKVWKHNKIFNKQRPYQELANLNVVVQSLNHWVTVKSSPLRPKGQQHARLPCPSLSPAVCSNSRPLSWWCHPTLSSPVAPVSACPQSLPASGSKCWPPAKAISECSAFIRPLMTLWFTTPCLHGPLYASQFDCLNRLPLG